MPLFSVIMRTWNRSAYLAEAIESVLSQTNPDFELIVVSDGCTDSTPKLMEHYLKKDKRIKYFQKEHSGIADTGNYGIERSTGKIIVQADSDDIQLPNKLDIALEGLEKTKADFTYSGYFHCDVNGKPWQYVPPKPMTIENIKRNEIGAGESIAYWRYVWEKTPYRKELAINDDAGFWVDLFKAGWKYKIIDKPSFNYRMIAESTSFSKKKEVDQLTKDIYSELDGRTDNVKIA